ncbi:MAG: YdcF family protein [Rhodobacteraceae bacterium]|nr:YdcF family protein [Alphaproteobacteria bacterium]MBT8473877.1 YdcF family protein [Alphaproteobacteria bacterium]NNK65876.1 YdcF family protein [Paracoccaceae bacterium]
MVNLSVPGAQVCAANRDRSYKIPNTDAIIVLSGPGGGAPSVIGETLERTKRGIALFQAGHAPLLVMSGGTQVAGSRPVADRMADVAVEAGVSEEAIASEPASHSTLQNALFTRAHAAVPADASIILVTHRYHLPRAWASFRWAGFRDITLVAADTGPIEVTRHVMMERIKWPANILRALAASVAGVAGVPADRIAPYLQ